MRSSEFCVLQDGETALNEACYMGKSEAVHLLLKAGAQTNIQDKVYTMSCIMEV